VAVCWATRLEAKRRTTARQARDIRASRRKMCEGRFSGIGGDVSSTELLIGLNSLEINDSLLLGEGESD
jgi:hypothetical protein